jgi:hypothetical protein
MNKISRRQFMKNTIVMGAALTASPKVLACSSQMKPPGDKDEQLPLGLKINHPNVNNLRVVGITDSNMTRDVDPSSSWARQEKLVVKRVVSENIDQLACGLAETKDPTHAWQTIFIKPSHKSWSETVVAIKTNHISRQHTRSAVMAKICHTFTDTLGVRPSNIHIYDACHGSSISEDTPFSDLPEGCRIENKWGGSSVVTSIPEPWKKGTGEAKCLKYLVDGSVDILVNIAMCKGHSQKFGGFSMTMKNHFGTFSPRQGHGTDGTGYLIAINRTPEILGELDKRSGEILFPRQQLCLIDALWASKGGPGGNPTHQPNFLAMGVLSPIVDYQVATKFRGEKMGWQPNMKITHRMLTDFGYNENDLPNGGKIIEL